VPLLPRTTLHDAFVAPALAAIRSKGGVVHLGTRVERLLMEGPRLVRAVTDSRGHVFTADAVILAIPNWDVGPLLELVPGQESVTRRAEKLAHSPIVTVELWFDRPWFRYPYAGLLGSPVQWLFNHPVDPQDGHEPSFYRLSAVISHAGHLVTTPKEDIIRDCLDEVHRFFPESDTVRVIASTVVKALKATFCARPGQQTLRPACKTSCGNLFLAGDWTHTGLPATIEGAVTSGVEAADKVIQG